MREILFRGKRVDNGEWVHGWYVRFQGQNRHSIFVHNDCHEVIPETLGQFTGLTDKNGTKIFEGDCLINPNGENGVVVWINERASFVLHCKTNKGAERWIDLTQGFCKNKEVTGNIHDK